MYYSCTLLSWFFSYSVTSSNWMKPMTIVVIRLVSCLLKVERTQSLFTIRKRGWFAVVNIAPNVKSNLLICCHDVLTVDWTYAPSDFISIYSEDNKLSYWLDIVAIFSLMERTEKHSSSSGQKFGVFFFLPALFCLRIKRVVPMELTRLRAWGRSNAARGIHHPLLS